MRWHWIKGGNQDGGGGGWGVEGNTDMYKKENKCSEEHDKGEKKEGLCKRRSREGCKRQSPEKERMRRMEETVS